MSSNPTEIPSVVYKDILEFPGYRVGDDGSVWRFYRGGGKKSRLPRWKKLNPAINSSGYLRCSLVRDGVKYERPVHRLVLEAFVGPRPPGQQCCHADGDKRNSRLSNLRWDTQEGNCADKEIHGRLPFGSDVPAAKLTEYDIGIILRLLEAGVAQFRIAYAFKVSDSTVSSIAKGHTWRRLTNISRNGIKHARNSD